MDIKIQFSKPILKHVTSKVIVQQQQFYAQFEKFLKTKYINGFKIFRATSTYKHCPKNFSLRLLNIKNTRNLLAIVQKLTFLFFAVLVAKFWNKNNCKLDKNLRNFSFYQKWPFWLAAEILMSKVGHSCKGAPFSWNIIVEKWIRIGSIVYSI